eukprot:8607003-Lingulodinium_polyedra.AAC.1
MQTEFEVLGHGLAPVARLRRGAGRHAVLGRGTRGPLARCFHHLRQAGPGPLAAGGLRPFALLEAGQLSMLL